jgi:hypothetical protein
MAERPPIQYRRYVLA